MMSSAMRSTVLPRASTTSRNVASFRTTYAQQRSFQRCRVLAVGKESAVHEENRAEKVEAEKQDQLAKQKQGKGEWKDGLASDSESIVKADRNDIDANKTISELQKESAKKAQQDKKSG